MSVPEGAPQAPGSPAAPGLGVVQPPAKQAAAEAPKAPENAGDASPGESERSHGAGWLAGILGVALAICAVLLANEFQVNQALEASLAQMQQQLQATTGALEVYEERMDDMRGSVGTISDQLDSLGRQLGALQQLLDEPVGPPPTD